MILLGKAKWMWTAIIATGFIAFTMVICFFLQPSFSPSIKMPDGTTLTLLSVNYGQPYTSAPDRNPAKRVWFSIREKLKWKRPGYDHSVTFWFGEDPIPVTGSYLWHIVLDDPLKPVHSVPIERFYTVVKQTGKPGVFGVHFKNCPTNSPEFALSFYKWSRPAPVPVQLPKPFDSGWGQPPKAFRLPANFNAQPTMELDQTNLLGRITVKNPALP